MFACFLIFAFSAKLFSCDKNFRIFASNCHVTNMLAFSERNWPRDHFLSRNQFFSGKAKIFVT